MIIKTNIREAVRSLYSAKQRTILALIGIVIGIGSVIAMVSIGKIVQQEALRQFTEMGTNVLTIKKEVVPGNTTAGAAIELTDAFEVPGNCSTITRVAPFTFGSGNTMFRGKKVDNGGVLGVTGSFPDLNKLRVQNGRFLSDLDEHTHFCVVGSAVARKLTEMGALDIIGEKIRIDNNLFTVIGSLAEVSPGGLRTFDANTAIFIHLTAMFRTQPGTKISNVLARVRDGIANSAAQAQVAEHFGRTRIKEVAITSPDEMIAQMEKQMRLYTLLLGAIGSISLIVGGVGVMNVMLVSVAERRKEIGIRRALGAKRGDVKSQFLIESIILSLVGGLIGILLGLGISFLLSYFAKWHFDISYSAILLGFGVSSAVGIFFGFYPAHQASKLDPIIALRSD